MLKPFEFLLRTEEVSLSCFPETTEPSSGSDSIGAPVHGSWGVFTQKHRLLLREPHPTLR
jgi:hypothetical protein